MVNNRWIPKLRSQDGNIIVRVAPGGEQFRVIVTDGTDDSDRSNSWLVHIAANEKAQHHLSGYTIMHNFEMGGESP